MLSELQRAPRGSAVRASIAAAGDAALYVSVLTLGEIRHGIELLPDGPRRRALAAWLGELRSTYADRVLAVDAAVAEAWGALNARLRRVGRPLPVVDGLLAATAMVHGLVIATRNVGDFAGTGVDLLDPWTDEFPR